MTEVDLYRFIAQNKLGVLGYTGEANKSQSALVGIAVTPQLEIVFDTVKSSRKYKNLMTRPACSFVFGWIGEQTLQYEGQAEELSGPILEHYQKIYFQAWPDGPARLSWPGIVYILVRPRWIRYSDFDQNPPLIQEFTFSTSGPMST
ncbi:MAG TPA: pyridoxamine 5'-phosphate oxidase family protein [Candidatus Angelobacter sp.]